MSADGMRIDVARRAGLSLSEIRELLDHGNDPLSGRLRKLAERRLPDIEALIERAEKVRTWLRTATDCRCRAIDDCALFDADTVSLPPAKDAPPLAALHAGERT